MSKLCVVIALSVVVTWTANGQGCSDAGFCSLGNLRVQSGDSLNLHRQKLSVYVPYGIGDDHVVVMTPGIEYSNQLSMHWTIQAKLTANYADGKLGRVSGPGDAFLSATYALKSKNKWKTSLMLGAKLPLNNSNLQSSGRSLPMQYQSSLGTVDLITGLNISSGHWQFAAGWQQPLSGKNHNSFLPVYWNIAEAGAYPPSRNFKRSGDVLVRSAYAFML